ncbi:hypothetical protein J4G48_0015450 [Bradyrhizobium barranii subsp. apii]|uniref:hypothetical protein n=1 Tax=Bradyrhizobium barranii TaxID=2992140 RepID=UPI001AA1B30E|nr:hypothetical protein [Bradyrhizobium barranii]UPT99359.1 hypothetical protein J4G48_0015450 [Bradyrhizobium barranii subsp. apii]
MRAFSPTGQEIVATANLVPGNAWCTVLGRKPDGTLEIEYGDETKMCWDGQHVSKDERGRDLFVAADGTEWPEDCISLEGEALRPKPAADAAPSVVPSPLTEQENQHLLMAVEASLRNARAVADGAWIPRWAALADRLKSAASPAAPSPAALEVLRGIRADNPEFETGAMVDHADVTARLGRRWGDICRVLDSSPVAPRLHVAVILEGGICQTVVSGNAALIGLAYDVIDYDTEGADETGEVMQEGGAFADACISGGIIEPASIRVVTDEDYENAAIAAGWQHGGDFDGFWYDGNRFESWKAAASADEDCPTYGTAREVCDAEEIHPFPEMVIGQDRRACSEGWGLFSDGETGGKLEIQADSESSIFVRNGMHYDDEAEAFVKAKAAEGSPYHIAALARVGQPG